MEILIVGIIVVALMVYASTRIKRSAAAAFDAEIVEENGFIVEKPEGFLHVLNGSDSYLFESYSKDFGTEDNRNVRLGRACLTSSSEAPPSSNDRLDERTEVIDDIHYQIFAGSHIEKDASFIDQYKTAEHNGQYYEFRTIRLTEASEDFSSKLEAMLDSFRLK